MRMGLLDQADSIVAITTMGRGGRESGRIRKREMHMSGRQHSVVWTCQTRKRGTVMAGAVHSCPCASTCCADKLSPRLNIAPPPFCSPSNVFFTFESDNGFVTHLSQLYGPPPYPHACVTFRRPQLPNYPLGVRYIIAKLWFRVERSSLFLTTLYYYLSLDYSARPVHSPHHVVRRRRYQRHRG